MKQLVMAAAAVAFSVFATPSHATLHKTHHRASPGATVTCNLRGCSDRPNRAPTEAGYSPRHRRSAPRASLRALDGNGNGVSGLVRSHKTGATARVGASHAAQFQAYVDDLEAHGAEIWYMGGLRRGRCSERSMHPCGKALDVCQDWRGHVSAARDCHLPRPPEMAAIAARHGLFEGSLWCNSDYGHAQVGESAPRCASRRYATGSWGHGHERMLSARRHRWHHRRRLATR